MGYSKNSQYSHTDVYLRITDYVIDALEKGVVPWQQRWCSLGLPRNITSGRVYRGWNVFFLNFITLYRQYKTPLFLTFKQAIAMGGNIRRGEKGYPVTYWAKIENKHQTDKSEGNKTKESENSRARFVPKLYTVFNIDQAEGITYAIPQFSVKSRHERIEACENVVELMPNCPPIQNGGNRAYYNRASDFVRMPYIDQFETSEDYYCTLFHELGHSTGHQSRLNRKELVESDGFGNELYSKEELTAELTATYLCGITGIERTVLKNSAAYIANWLTKLRNDKTLILKAAAQAQKATDYILNCSTDQPEPLADDQSSTVLTPLKKLSA